MPFGFGSPLTPPLSVWKHRMAAQNCRLLADGFLEQAIKSGDEEFFEMALRAEHDAVYHEEMADYGGDRR